MKILAGILLILLPVLIFSGQLPARISVVSGEVIIRKSYSDNDEYGIVNLPVEAGDSIYVKSGYVEIDIEDGSTLRIGENSSCIIIHTGNSEADNSISTRIYANFGEFELFSSTKANLKSYLDLETDVGIVTSFPSATIRVKVNNIGEIEAEVIKGTGAYKTKREEKLLNAGDFATINSTGIGSIVSRPVPENSSITQRSYKPSTYDTQNSPSRAYVPKNIESSSQTLDDNGTWIYVSSHGYCWKPKVVIVDWKPYYDGEWVWTAAWGWTWVSYEPWGWWTYHYGHWVYSRSWGWVWVPGSRWYPARVVWYWGPGWIAWYPYPYYYWYPWFYDHWWICVSTESFYRPRYRYHDPRYGFVGDKPTRTYDPVDVPDINSGTMVRSPDQPENTDRNLTADNRLTNQNPSQPVRETPDLNSGRIEPVRREIGTRSPDLNSDLTTRTGGGLTTRNSGELTTSRPISERTPTVNSNMTPPRQNEVTTRTPSQETNTRVTTTQPTTRTNPPTNSNTRPETNDNNRNYNPPTNSNTRPETNDNNRNNNPPTNSNTRPETNDNNRNYNPPTNSNT
ncbi:hypothetical protein JW890_03960, partial [candidate division WOR-3 bacterium]|nr:hypothetical protein [candidate division WOR-3 bacterium]